MNITKVLSGGLSEVAPQRVNYWPSLEVGRRRDLSEAEHEPFPERVDHHGAKCNIAAQQRFE
ncbi:hypothetical protein N7519_011381 [Penicillium mononematosum]|uniref:uncharacterized protein n=1 Tax=Penicillium mononematosum TaxID=268346 RepID=UPI0025479E60|nr:uncharacterized protein N7519_011381 [Penicillium mononematosum]KAJ6180920.1 hypothetical protein N7519_011381 [Penicillium mononematosum]